MIKLLSQYLYSLNVFGIVPLGYHMKALNKWKFVSCICTFTLICSHSYLLQKDAKKNSHEAWPWKKYWYCFIALTYNLKLINVRYLHSYISFDRKFKFLNWIIILIIRIRKNIITNNLLTTLVTVFIISWFSFSLESYLYVLISP